MFIGRVISGAKIEDMPFFIEVTDEVSDFSIPTLIVGKKRAIELFGKENIHVLDRNINENVSWTYAKNERRTEYEEDIEKFKNRIIKQINSNVSYYFINIFTEKLSILKKFIKYMYGDERKSVYITEKHIYIYSGKKVIGLSLPDFEYIGISSKKVIRKIKSNPKNIVFDTTDIPEIKVNSLLNTNIIIPYVHYLSF